ncbi:MULTISPECIES: DUF4824 family protein [Pseudomonadaceae]|uniref:DUF4824 family protein n=1 Tax=Pseudomonas denitrificans TaxID=43306 RepID=A0A9X7R7X4_PSEDE|nr:MULTISPECIES: DUF4824 family protein [Pseudomonadaceae]OQR34762.1 DUF4824 domain-containing protein [Pseudomonas sp. T]MBD9513728.1 DUF4824 family protein [Pseudomonas sp. PDM22]MBD9632297.1 DUF4824 family protein [Pseudomonas sp. PDM19]MBD9680695.1 DUF4824 family protein [Pseudomonas sp. PDM18]MBD9682900.1 DUF4824 family protein [Pseudomonas sp. PDM20]
MNWTRTHALVGGAGLILLVNAVALGGVAWNRSAEPESRLPLSQRELIRNTTWHNENSGLSLRLRWRTPTRDEGSRHNRGWLPAIDAQKMAKLGFNMPAQVDDDSAQHFGRQQSRDALLVLELAGPLYEREVQLTRKRLDEARQAADAAPQNARLADERDFIRRELDSEEKTDTRLLLKDVGLDLQALRTQYPDRQRYLIIHGRVRPISNYYQHIWTLGGTANGIGSDSINVPYQWRGRLDEITAQPHRTSDGLPQPFVAEVAFGRRLEPWIERIEIP